MRGNQKAAALYVLKYEVFSPLSPVSKSIKHQITGWHVYSEHDCLKLLERLELLAMFWSVCERDLSKIVAITMEGRVLYKFIFKKESFRSSEKTQSS